VDCNGVKEVMGIPSSIDVVPPVFSEKPLGISGDVSSSFPFPASDSFIWEIYVSCEGISVSFIFPLVFDLSCIFISKLGGGPSCSGGGVIASPCKILGKKLHLWLWNDVKPICESGDRAYTLFNTSS
jgi:hypothetical protein